MSYFFLYTCTSIPAKQDWEKEAKKRVRIKIDNASPTRRKTIYELDSYEPSAGPSAVDIRKLVKEEDEEDKEDDEEEEEEEEKPMRKVRYSVSVVNISIFLILFFSEKERNMFFLPSKYSLYLYYIKRNYPDGIIHEQDIVLLRKYI